MTDQPSTPTDERQDLPSAPDPTPPAGTVDSVTGATAATDPEQQPPQEDDPGRAVRTVLQGEEVTGFPLISPMARRGRVLRITEIGEDILHRRLAQVTEFGTDELAALIDDMHATMLVAEGVGLAANQVGVDAQVFVYDLTDSGGVRHVGHVLNPRIEVLSPDDTEEMTEGCLSVPGPGADLFRPTQVRLHGADFRGRALTLEATGYLARCFQHETGHLHGQLYVDLLAKRVRRRILAEMQELRPEVITRRRQVATHLDKEPAQYPDQGALSRQTS